ncbi:MAG TPA: sialidase family protein [Gemmatimonadaceae bacterium]|nr:sialidase family protein [Gemmatimonadaceae bacterium]
MPTRRFISPALALAAALAACRPGPDVALDAARAVDAGSDPGAAPIVATAGDGREAVAWVSAPGGGSEGRLHVRVNGAAPVELRDALGPIEPHGEAPPKLAWDGDGRLHALYVVSRLVPGRRFPASALRHATSADGGRTWGAPSTVTDDSLEFGSHNFHALHAASDGTLYVAWLDGRAGRSATFVTHSTDGGRTWAPNVRVTAGESCPCCRTAIATARDGTVYLAWRAVLPGSVRDVVVARSRDLGATWTTPVRVHADDWVFDGCPHAGPALQVDAAGRVHVAWWTGREGGAGVWYARSDDGARTFAAPVPLGVAEFSRPAHVQLALADGERVVAAWDDGTRRIPRVVLRVSRNGGRGFGAPVAVSDDGRATSFPVLATPGRTVRVLWAEQSAGAHEHAEHARPNMKDSSAVMGLKTVGASRVLRREGRLP